MDGKKEKKWYAVHTYVGYENRVKANLEQRIETMGMEDKIFKVLVPIEQRVSIKGGKKKITKRKVFPGYVLIEMILDEQSYFVVRNTPGVTGFVGSGGNPVPLNDEEVKSILQQIGIEEKKQIKIDLEPGETVKIVDGPFEGSVGIVKEINSEKGKVKVLLNVFGRETPVEIDFMQLEKM
ncbi:MAG: transcription termination/antitermination protein NusG [Synergistetes bacterium]|nr:transcription termination/antitermination protein NusG [Synergistota bacterium]MCX8127925.1 transcription termination/antitermination protein NusG [Synergistota bacterium]MDW8192187.1 transcription termination/antitermination protein NusG [Synergistota bacterium]